MGIRQRFNKPKVIRYHRLYGSVRNPPLADQGGSGKAWPNGSAILATNIPRYKGRPIVIGWICHQEGVKTYGLWIATKVAVPLPGFAGEAIIKEKKALPFIDTKYAEPGSYEWFDCISENTPMYRAIDRLLDAFADKHDILL